MSTRKMPKRKSLPLTELTAISILDGRNRLDVAELAPHVSEFNIIRTRIEVEARYLIALSEAGVVRSLKNQERKKLASFGANIGLSDARGIKRIEEETQHDVRAMERAFRTKLEGTSLADVVEMVHLGLTSEDVNNLTYRLILKRANEAVFVPALEGLIDGLVKVADSTKAVPMIARTHGQAAVPTTVGKELIVFASRLNREVRQFQENPLVGKLTGAVGNLNALHAAYPNIDWIDFSEKFVQSFGFEPNLATTQIGPYEDMISCFQNYLRINGIVMDLNQDMWRYISDDWFIQEARAGEIGSSTMPQKINPIRFENSEGNIGKANALFEFMARKLAVSRLQRDLSDSTVIRDMGVPLGYSLLAYKNTLAGLRRVKPNQEAIAQALNRDWSILAEAAQTVMRRLGVEDPYSLMANLTRGRHLGPEEWRQTVDQLPISEKEKGELKKLTPETYTGLAAKLTERAIGEIKSTRAK